MRINYAVSFSLSNLMLRLDRHVHNLTATAMTGRGLRSCGRYDVCLSVKVVVFTNRHNC